MKITNSLLVFIILLGLAQICASYRILVAYPFTGKSHFLFVYQLSKGLVRKGHQVDIISPFPQKEKFPNLTQIITLPSKASFVDKVDFKLAKSFTNDLTWMYHVGKENCEKLENPEVLNLARNPPKDPPYDLLIISVSIKHQV